MGDPMDSEIAPGLAGKELVAEQLLERLRTYGGTFREFSRRFATWLGLHATDAEALVEILAAEEHGVPLSPARLSERIGKSNPATTAVLNRLEHAGLVIRTREHTDRRVVTLRSSPEVHSLADEFFGPLGVRVGGVMADYSAAELRRFGSFLDDLLGVMHSQLAQPLDPTPQRIHSLRPTDRES